MKNLIVCAIALFTSMAVSAQAEIKFDQETVDYGTIEYGSDGVRSFTFTNVGDEPLVISDVKSTCGCTVPEKPKDPIAPGKTGVIKVKYDTKRPGPIRKTITVYANVESSQIPLKIKGYINKKDTKSVLEK
ncbi:DUF1573 domain-containing protein [Mesonia sp. MT50]|uniref:DUF1573 domain-containing protein n=1 Tax=Mesonia profundi TaxID=3070998 RepID=A0ABU0ZZK7_9FLAO|nr:DUF1573 domain-containing protein [Mesonia profundi]MDQ7916890.1 DUF1573 domain-containing protein [Mesonia profundi]